MNRTQLKMQCYESIDMLLEDLRHRPHGQAWWWQLPPVGRNNRDAVRHAWVNVIYAKLFPPSFQQILLQASVDAHGQVTPQSTKLYRWLVRFLYHNSPQELYTAWLALPRGE